MLDHKQLQDKNKQTLIQNAEMQPAQGDSWSHISCCLGITKSEYVYTDMTMYVIHTY